MAVVGQASVVVRALVDTFRNDLRKSFDGAEKDADASGGRSGKRFGERFSSEASKGFNKLDTGGIEKNFEQAGDRAGGRFSERFRARYQELNRLRLDGLENEGGRAGDSSGKSFISKFGAALSGFRAPRGVFDRAGEDSGREFNDGLLRESKRGAHEFERTIGDAGDNVGRNLKAIKIDLPDIGGGLATKVIALIPLVGLLGGALAALVGGLTAMAGAAIFAAGSLAILATGLVGLVAGGITAFLAFGGIGKALGALNAQQASAGKTAIASAKQQKAAAEQIAAAQERIEHANQGVTDAEYNLTQAQKSARAAQEDLTRAREDAKAKLEDLQLQLRGSVLGEEEATLRLQKAQEDYQKVINNPASTPRDAEQARIDLEQAELSLDEATKRRKDITKETETANKKGVEGADNVVAAKDRVAAANHGVQQSQLALSEAHEAVTEAIKGLAKAHETAAAGSAASTAAADRLKKALAGLSPEAIKFARYLFSLKPLLAELKTAAGSQLFTPLTLAVQRLVKDAFPVLLGAVRATSAGLGHFFTELLGTFSNKEFAANFTSIATGLSKINATTKTSTFGEFGKIIGNIFRIIVGLGNAALPLFQRFTTHISNFTNKLALSFEGLDKNGKPKIQGITKTINHMGEVAKSIGHVISGVFRVLKHVFEAALPTGEGLFKDAGGGLDKLVASTTKGQPGFVRLQKFFTDIKPPFKAVIHFVGVLAKEFLKLGESGPDKKGKKGGLTAFIDGATNALPKIGKFIKDITAGIGKIVTSTGFTILAESIGVAVDLIAKLAGFLSGDSPIAKLAKGLLAAAAAWLILNKAFKVTGLKALSQSIKVGKADPRSPRAQQATGLGAAIQGARGNRVVDKLDRIRAPKDTPDHLKDDKGFLLREDGTHEGKRSKANRFGSRVKGPRHAAGGRGGRAAAASLAVVGVTLAASALSGDVKGLGDATKAIGANLKDNLAQYLILAGPALVKGLGKGLSLAKQGLTGAASGLGGVLKSRLAAGGGGDAGFIDFGAKAGRGAGKVKALEEGASSAGKASGVFSKLGGVAKSAGTAVRGIGLAMTTALGPVGLIIIAVAAVAAGLIYAYKHSETFRNIVNAIGSALASFGKFVFGVVIGVFKFLKKHIEYVALAFGPIGLLIFGVISAFRKFGSVKNIMTAIGIVVGQVLGGIQDGFDATVGYVKRSWDGIRSAVSDPIKSIVEFAYNKGLVPIWNNTAGLLGAKKLEEIHFSDAPAKKSSGGGGGGSGRTLAIAKGGVIPGYAPGVDSVRAILSPGEGILVPEAVRAIAQRMGLAPGQAIQAINAAHSSRVSGPRWNGDTGHFAGGGFVTQRQRTYTGGLIDIAEGAVSGVGHAVSGVAGAIQNKVLGLLAKGVGFALNGVYKIADAVLPDNGFGKMLKQFPRSIGKTITDHLAHKDKKTTPDGGGSFTPGPVGTGKLSGTGYQAIERYFRGTGVSGYVTSDIRKARFPGDNSYHIRGRAADFSGPHNNDGYRSKALRSIFEVFANNVGGQLSELILAGAPYNIKNKHRVPGYAWGSPGKPGNHWNHVHVALAKGGTVLPRPGGTAAVLGEAGRAESVVDTGTLNKRLAGDGRGTDQIVAELRNVRATLERIQRLGGVNVENLHVPPAPTHEDTGKSVARGLRTLAFELGN